MKQNKKLMIEFLKMDFQNAVSDKKFNTTVGLTMTIGLTSIILSIASITEDFFYKTVAVFIAGVFFILRVRRIKEDAETEQQEIDKMAKTLKSLIDSELYKN